jgi:asparagine synthase (glutamine-hydrolysing)
MRCMSSTLPTGRWATAVDWRGQSNLEATLARLLLTKPPTAQDHPHYVDTQAALGGWPQAVVSADKRCVVVSDARIDNRQELLNLLRGQIKAPNTIGDAELILAAYKQWGQNCPEQLTGDFAFVVWDAHKATLLAACDGMNMRTLSYLRTPGGLCLASQGQQLLQHPQHTPQLCELALAGWISGRPDPRVSMFDGIEVLPPGHSLQADAQGVNIRKFWDIDPQRQIRYQNVHDYQDHLQELLQRAVSDRMRSPHAVVASQMSGGMDSTTVTALASRQAAKENKQLLVISHSYRSLESCDETDLIRETLAHLKLKNSRFLAAEEHTGLAYRELYPPALENPGTVLSPRYADEMALLKDAGASVLLTGSGGDEMVWGHSLTYSQRLLRGNLGVVPEVISGVREMQLPLLRTLRQLFVNPFVPAWLRQLMGRPAGTVPLPEWVPKAAIARLNLNERLAGNSSTRFSNPALQARYDALQWSSTINSVRSYGAVAAQYGIEVRHPFFDTRLAEFSFAIPDDLWLRHGYPKWLLRKTMNGVLPDSVCWNRQKVIFDSFFAGIIRDQAENVRAILADRRLEEMGLLDTDKLLQSFDRVVAGQQGFSVDLLYALMVQVWVQEYSGAVEG